MLANLTLSFQVHMLKKIIVNQKCRMIITCLSPSSAKLQAKMYLIISLILTMKYFWIWNILSIDFFKRNGQHLRPTNISQYSFFFFHYCYSFFISFIGKLWLKTFQTKSILKALTLWTRPSLITRNLYIKIF